MLRFLAGCVVVAALCVGAVVVLSKGIPSGEQLKRYAKADFTAPPAEAKPPKNGLPSRQAEDAKPPTDVSPAKDKPDDDKPVRVVAISGKETAQPMILQDGRILATQSPNVPSERDGKLLFMGTPARPGEYVPKGKRFKYPVPTLAVAKTLEYAEWRNLPEEERLTDVDTPGKYYRAVRPGDSFGPGDTVIVRNKMAFRKLDVGDRVTDGQTLGVINPALALDDLYVKHALIDSADAEIRMALALREEYERRVAQMGKLRAGTRGAVSDDDYYAAVATAARYKEEAATKRAGLKKSQRELSASLTTLKMHLLKAPAAGIVKALYKQPGEAVKQLEPVLQIQNPTDLRVEAQVEIQDALALRDRLELARKYREAARDLAQKSESTGGKPPAAAQQYMAAARDLLTVEVEASRIEPPCAVLSGHLQEVTSVAVSQGASPRIVSGSEDHTVRVWDRVPNTERWTEVARLDHHAVVRAVACTGPAAKKNLLLTATATGRGRLFDLSAVGEGEGTDLRQMTLSDRHAGAINAVAFNADGSICATGGEDRAICLWETEKGTLLGRYKGAHSAGVTSLAFTPRGQLVSAGKDRRLVLWNLTDGGEGGRTLARVDYVDRRSGDVPQLGIDADGTHAVFDRGNEIQVLSIEKRKVIGSLANPPGSPGFATLALFSPDGSSILTNGNAAGRLQLWRTPTSKVRAAELRHFAWSNGQVTSAAFDPSGAFAATGTSDSRVLVWAMPGKAEAEKPLPGELSYVEEFLDTSLRRVAVRATVVNPGWIIPGGSATIVVPPAPTAAK